MSSILSSRTAHRKPPELAAFGEMSLETQAPPRRLGSDSTALFTPIAEEFHGMGSEVAPLYVITKYDPSSMFSDVKVSSTAMVLLTFSGICGSPVTLT